MFALVLALAAQPFFEKDPWDGCKPGTWVKYKSSRAQPYTVKYVGDKDGARTFERDPPEDDFEAAVTFAPWLTELRKGYKKGARSTATVTLGKQQAKALVEEFLAADEESTERYRVTSTDAAPGGIVRIERHRSGEGGGEKWTYELATVEKLKVGGREIECLRFDYATAEGKKRTTSSWWLSKELPGLVGKSKVGDTTIEAVDFKAEK